MNIPIDEDMFKSMDFQENSSSIFSYVSIQEIKDKIATFKEIDLKSISDKDLMNAILDVMNINVNGNLQHVFFSRFTELTKGTKLYRIRTVDSSDMSQFASEVAYWNPPVEYITRRGRLNKIGESLLYTSLDSSTPFSELGLVAGQTFALIIYETNQQIKLNIIGGTGDIPELSDIDNQKYQLYNEFLRREFTKEVKPGQEHLYRVSEQIAKTYFDLPPRSVQDALMYPSVASEGKYNICFRPDIAKEVLDFKGAVFGSMILPGKQPQIKFHSIRFPDSDGNISCYEVYPYLMKDLLSIFSPIV